MTKIPNGPISSCSNMITYYTIFLITIHNQIGSVRAEAQDTSTTQWYNTYQKPKPSNAPCIDTIERMHTILSSQQQEASQSYCLGCPMVQETCPTTTTTSADATDEEEMGINCQEMIDAIYINCDGVTLPRYYYYDAPENTITGTFNDEHVQRQMKESAARCGCNGSMTLVTRSSILLAIISVSIWHFII